MRLFHFQLEDIIFVDIHSVFNKFPDFFFVQAFKIVVDS